MSDTVTVALIVTVPGVLNVILSIFNRILALKALAQGHQNAAHIKETKDAVITLEENTNSIKDALIKATGEAEHARGYKQGAEDARGEANEESRPG